MGSLRDAMLLKGMSGLQMALLIRSGSPAKTSNQWRSDLCTNRGKNGCLINGNDLTGEEICGYCPCYAHGA